MKNIFTYCIGLVTVGILNLYSVPSAIAQPANDDCSGAITLTVDAACTSFNTATATDDGGANSIGCTRNCGGPKVLLGVWYSFTASASNQGINISSSTFTVGSDYPYVVVFDACGGTEVACFNDLDFDGGGNVTVTGLTPGNTYWILTGGICEETATACIQVITAPYCTPCHTNTANDWTVNVTFNTINNNSGQDGACSYGDYTSQTTTVSKGSSYTLSVTIHGDVSPGATGLQCRAYFDWNQDADFGDAGEEFILGKVRCDGTIDENGTQNATSCAGDDDIEISITIPAGATSGNTRMRVIQQYSAVSGPCVSTTFGESEDYTINITGTSPVGDAYGFYSPDGAGTITDCEITATGGSTGGTGCLVCDPADGGYSSIAISGYSVITEDNTTCTQVDVNYNAGSSATWNLGTGATNPTPTGSAVTTQYSAGSTGRKNIVYSGTTYNGFQNIVMDPPATGSVLGTNNTCPGTYSYTSSEAGVPGLTFAWTCSDPAGGTSSIATPAASPTDVTFTNSTGGPLVFPLTLTITSGCCGALNPVLYNVTVSNLPAEPVIVPAAVSVCIGGSTDLVISPTTAGFNYVWYDAASGGTNLGGAITYTVSPVLSGATSYYAEAANSIGCTSATRDESVVTGTDTPPTIPSITICMVGTESMCVTSPISGATYSWYAAATGGAPLQTGAAACYSLANAGGAGNVENIYVTVTDGTCDETTRSLSSYTIDVGCPNLYRSITTGDWFTTSTWEYSTDNGITWTTPVPGGTPTSTDGIIQIRDGDNVTIAATVTYDEVTVELGGTLTYSVGTVTVANGTGVDLIINGTYVDEGSTSHSFTGNWKFGTKGRLIRANNGTCNNCWMDAYDGGTTCGNVPSTAEWIFRYTGAGTPSITSTNSGRNCYPTLIIENTSGGAWAGMSFIGSGFYPTVEGNLDVGGSSNAAVIFGSSNTNASPVLVKGSITVRGDFAHILNNDGTGFEIQGDSLSVLGSGTLAYSGSNDRLIKFSGSSEQNISGAGTLGIYDLTIDNSADSVQMNRTVTVDNNLTLTNGVLKLNAYTLTMAKATATITDISRTNGFIYSENENSYINWTNTPAGANIFVFPFVYDGEYIPFDFEKDGGDPGADIAIATWHTSVDNNTDLPTGTTLLPATGDANYIDRWYDITPSVVFDAELTFRWTTGELSGITPINTSYHWNGSAWDSWTGTTTGNNVTCTWTAYSGGGGGGGPLPISLLDFNATYNSQTQNVDLDWATASEENNDYFTIQKSRSDATDFDLVVQVPGAGSSNQTLYYEAVDENPYYGLSYYRLKQTDYDGTYTYSDLVAVNILKGLEFSVRPNPARDMLQIVFGSAKNNTVFVMTPEYNAAIKIYDTRGKLVYEKRFDGTFYKFNIDISGFQQGMYLVTLTANDEKYIAKFVKEN